MTKRSKEVGKQGDDSTKYVATTQAPSSILFEGSRSPLSYLETWDFFIVFFAVMLRFMIDTEKKSLKVKEKDQGEFEFFKYFDGKRRRRWFLHVGASFLGLLVLPEIFLFVVNDKLDISLSDWTLFGSAVVGFVGFDLIRIFEKIFVGLLEKVVGYKQDNQ